MNVFFAWLVVLKRHPAKWVAPVLSIVIFYYAWQGRTHGVAYWPAVSARIGFGQALVCPIFIGISAWIATRERSRALTELSRTMSGMPFAHISIMWSSTLAWALCPYILAGALVAGMAAPLATWGRPAWEPMIAGAAAITAAVSLGFALGTLVPVTLLAPVWTITWWFLDGILPLQESSIQYFAPRTLFENVGRSVYFETYPSHIDLLQAAWLGSIALVSLWIVITATDRRLSPKTLGFSAIATSVAIISAVQLASSPVQARREDLTPIPYQPLCEQHAPITVCVHPAQARLLDDVAVTITNVLRPVAGIPGLPEVARDARITLGPELQGRELVFVVDDQRNLGVGFAHSVALSAVFDIATSESPLPNLAQAVVATWLLTESGYPADQSLALMMPREIMEASDEEYYQQIEEFYAALERFSSLPADQRHAWLLNNLLDLQQHRINLSDLP